MALARSSPSGFARGYSPLPGEVRRSSSASPLITPPRVELPSSLSGTVPPLGTSLIASVPAVPPLGSGLTDLRSTVVAQQRQLDGLVDKVASLLSAMHAEVLEDVRKTCRHGGGGLENGSALGMDAKDLVRLRDLRETEGSLRVWMQGQLRENWERLEGKLREVQYHMSNEVRDVQGHVAGEVHSLRARISHLEDMTLDDDDNDPAELRQHLEVRLEAQTAQVHSTMGQLAAELRQQLEEASPTEHLAEDVLRRVDGRLQEHEAKDGVLGRLRDDLRQEAEARLEAKMAQTFGLAQRLMNELRQELQGQVVQVHETSQHLAVELRRGLEAQQLHLQASVQQLAREGLGRGAGSKAAGNGVGGGAAVEEQLAGCRAAAADCARCAIEAAEATDHMEAQLEAFMQRTSDELQRELQKGLDEVSRTTAEGPSSRGDATSVEASVAELEEELAKVHAALADTAQAAREASSKSSSAELGLRELSQRLPGELRKDGEAREERLGRSLQEQMQEAVRKGLESTQASLSESRGSGDVPAVGGGAAAAAVEEALAKVRVEAASSARDAAEASAKAGAVEASLQELSKRLAGDAEAQEARLGESLRQFVRDEVQQGLGSAAASREAPAGAGAGAPSAAAEEQLAGCKAALADCTRCVGEASAKVDSMESRFNELSDRLTSKLHEGVVEQESRMTKSLQQLVADEVQKGAGEAQRGADGAGAQREGQAEAEAAAAVAEKHLAGCKAAAEECGRCIEEAGAKVDAAEARLKACGEELQAQLGAEGRRLLGELTAARPAGAGAAAAAAPAAEGGGEAPTLVELAQKLGELDEEVGSHRMLLVALRERVLQEGDYQEGDEESRSGSPSGGSPSGQGPVSAPAGAQQGGMLGGRSARSASGSSDGFD